MNPFDALDNEEYAMLKIPVNWAVARVEEAPPFASFKNLCQFIFKHEGFEEVSQMFWEANEETLLKHHEEFLRELGSEKMQADAKDFADEALVFFGMTIVGDRKKEKSVFN